MINRKGQLKMIEIYSIAAGTIITAWQTLLQPVKITPLELIIILIGVTAIASI